MRLSGLETRGLGALCLSPYRSGALCWPPACRTRPGGHFARCYLGVIFHDRSSRTPTKRDKEKQGRFERSSDEKRGLPRPSMT
jgi:hypothetical protein